MAPSIEAAHIFQKHGAAYRQAHPLSRQQQRVMRAIEVCRSAALGGHVEECSHCLHARIAYNSCRNRHCPKCQHAERARWLEARRSELLPVEYFHVVFTLPAEAAAIAFHNKEVVYGILFRAAAGALTAIAADSRHLGAEIGCFGVLHTWGQNLLHHPHVHFVIPGGGLSPGYERWVSCRPGFFLPVRVLSRLFRRLFLGELGKAFNAGLLRFSGEVDHLRERTAFVSCVLALQEREWVVYAKPPFGGAEQALRYLGRYTHRVAISNQRLLALTGQQVSFQWNDYRHKRKEKPRVMSVAIEEFIRRFLLPPLPPGFQRIRHFGFLANCHRKEKLALCRQLLAAPIADLLPLAQALEQGKRLVQKEEPLTVCRRCGIGVMRRAAILPAFRWPLEPPDSS